MNTHSQLAALLTPGNSDNMPDKWRAAWTLLDEDKTTPEVLRCNARCWLTYRAIEGTVKHEELMNRVLPVNGEGLAKNHFSYVRWLTSQAAASFLGLSLGAQWAMPARSRRAITSSISLAKLSMAC